jgi:hypothetical protein
MRCRSEKPSKPKRLGETDQRGRLHAGMLRDDGDGFDGNLVGMLEREFGDLAQPLAQRRI